MKLPTEGELIEVENFMARWKPDDGPVKFASEALYRHHRVWNTLQTLIALARDFTERLAEVRGSYPPPRRTAPKPSVIVQPKKKKRTPMRKIDTHR